MIFPRFLGVIGLILAGSALSAQDAPRQGAIQKAVLQKIDLERRIVTLKGRGEERDFLLTEQTQILGAAGKDLRERLRGFKSGAEVFFKVAQKDGKDYLVGMKLVQAGNAPPLYDASKLVPLTELGKGEYQGFKGGLYPDSKNERPKAHEAAGLRLAGEVQPLNAEGKPAPEGKIVMLSVGMSNTSQVSVGFQQALAAYQDKNPHLVFVNGAQGGLTAARIKNPDDGKDGKHYWTVVDKRLEAAKLTRAQVQVVWIKQADAGPNEGFPGYAKKLQAELTQIVQILPKRFPNVKLVYLSSRTYGGYAKTKLNPEPYAYESGFSVKWLIGAQLQGDPALNFDPKAGKVRAPWLSWGPYLWAKGSAKRADGFSYDASDFGNDGTHPSAAGVAKVSRLMLDFFMQDTTSRPWFVRNGK